MPVCYPKCPSSGERGRVFKLVDDRGSPFPAKRWGVRRVVAAISEAARIMVDERVSKGETVRKFASAHNLRRAFGQRLASKVTPTDLMQLMRHADISTTMKYCVGR